MFVPFHLLPHYDFKKHKSYENRWETQEGQLYSDKIKNLIREGAGEDFLQYAFEQDKSKFLEDMGDLKGIKFFEEKLDFTNFQPADNFEAIDFSYASFFHTVFKNATFSNVGFTFTTFHNCEFINCNFAFTSFYGSNLEQTKFINCEFVEYDRISNCELAAVSFESCFFSSPIFSDCKFDEQSIIENIREKASKFQGVDLNKGQIADMLKGIKESYLAGGVVKKADEYLFKEKQAVTKYNTNGSVEKIGAYILEWTTGYGIRPLRVIVTMVTIFIIFSLSFISRIGFSEGLLLSAGAFFTFGANTQYLQTIGTFFKILYVLEAFTGIGMMALLITILANKWFRER